MKRPLTILLAATAVGMALPAQTAMKPRPVSAIPSNEVASQIAMNFRHAHLAEGRSLAKRVKKLVKELDWHRDLDTAKQESLQTGKPIFWLQMLGDLDGHT